MKCIYQLIHNDTGARSEPIECDRQEFANKLAEWESDQIDSAGIVVLMEKHDPDQEYEFSKAPFMYAKTFVEHFRTQENG